MPIYFVNRVHHDFEKRCQMIEKVALALVTSTRRLKPYFQSHQVIINKSSYQIGVEKAWACWNDGSMIHRIFRIWPPIWTSRSHEDPIYDRLSSRICWQCLNHPKLVEFFYGRCANVKGSGVGVILEGPDSVTLEQTIKFNFKVLKN